MSGIGKAKIPLSLRQKDIYPFFVIVFAAKKTKKVLVCGIFSKNGPWELNILLLVE